MNKCEKGAMLLNTSPRFYEFGISKHISLKQTSIFLLVSTHNSSRVNLILKFILSLFGDRSFTVVSPSYVSLDANKHILVHRYEEETLVPKN